jgi:hypothetical protein
MCSSHDIGHRTSDNVEYSEPQDQATVLQEQDFKIIVATVLLDQL